MQRKQIWSVDFLKGIAIMMVILVHSAQRFDLPERYSMIPRFAQMGCQIFFVMSSFTLCLSLGTGYNGYRVFVRRRLSRLVPEYWMAILVNVTVGVLSLLLTGENMLHTDLNLLNVLANVFMVHGLTPTAANNSVVRGGWFVGTLIILYLITPLLFRIFEMNNRIWRKIRRFSFPIMMTLAGWGTIFLTNGCTGRWRCDNNTFVYFSMLNQLGCYSLGYSLWDIYRSNEMGKVRFPGIKALLYAVGTFVIFFSGKEWAFVVVPFVFGVATMYSFIALELSAAKRESERKVTAWICRYGKKSFSIYLTHFFVVYEGAGVAALVLSCAGVNFPPLYQYIILMPFIFIGSIILGTIFDRYTKRPTAWLRRMLFPDERA